MKELKKGMKESKKIVELTSNRSLTRKVWNWVGENFTKNVFK